MRIERTSPRLSVTVAFSGCSGGTAGHGSGAPAAGRPGPAERNGGRRGGRDRRGGGSRRPADAGERRPDRVGVGGGELRQRVAQHPRPVAVAGRRGRRAACGPAEGGDRRGIDPGQLAQRPRERLLDVGLGVAEQLPDELQAARGDHRCGSPGCVVHVGDRGDGRADEPALPAAAAVDELLQLRPAVRLAQDPRGRHAGQRVDGDPVVGARDRSAGCTCQARSGSAGEDPAEESDRQPAQLAELVAGEGLGHDQERAPAPTPRTSRAEAGRHRGEQRRAEPERAGRSPARPAAGPRDTPGRRARRGPSRAAPANARRVVEVIGERPPQGARLGQVVRRRTRARRSWRRSAPGALAVAAAVPPRSVVARRRHGPLPGRRPPGPGGSRSALSAPRLRLGRGDVQGLGGRQDLARARRPPAAPVVVSRRRRRSTSRPSPRMRAPTGTGRLILDRHPRGVAPGVRARERPAHHLVEDRGHDPAVGDPLPALEVRAEGQLGPAVSPATCRTRRRPCAFSPRRRSRRAATTSKRPTARHDLRRQGCGPCAPRT